MREPSFRVCQYIGRRLGLNKKRNCDVIGYLCLRLSELVRYLGEKENTEWVERGEEGWMSGESAWNQLYKPNLPLSS